MYLRSVVVRSGEFSVEEVLLDELTAVQELASWQEPLTPWTFGLLKISQASKPRRP